MKKFFTLIAAAFALTANAQLADGDYFIRNVETDRFLNGGNSWGTKASLTREPQIMGVAKVGEGVYTIDSHYSNGGDKHFLAAGDNTFIDGLPANHTIEAVEGGYTIKDSNGKYLVTTDGSVVNFNGDTPQVWQFLTKADYIAEAVAMAKNGGIGILTGLIPDANFSRNNQDFNLWVGASKMTKGGPNDAMGETSTGMNAEKWGGNSKSIDMGTKIEGLPNGRYYISFQGFYRYNNTDDNTNDVAAAAHANGTEQINVYFIANDMKVPFMSIADEVSVKNYGKMPFSQAEAAQAFSKSEYLQGFAVDVTDGTLSLQVLKEEKDHIGCDWTIIDNIRLSLHYVAEDADYTVYAKVTADEQSKTFTGQEIKVSTLSGVATVTLPAAQAGPYKMESQSVKVNIDAEGKISMVEGQTIKFTGAEDVVVTVTGVEGTLAEDKVNVTVTGTGDNGKDVKVVYSSDPIIEPTVITWDFSEYTDRLVLADDNKTVEYNGMTMVGNTQAGYANDYVDAASGFHMNGTSSATTRHLVYTPEKDGKVTVTYRSNNATATDRITAIGTEVVKGSDLAALLANEKVLAAGLTDGATLQTIEADLKAGTTYYFYLANGGQSIMKVEFAEGESTAANTVVAAKTVSVAKFIENGQVVIVKNGKKYNMAGQEM